MSYVIVCRGLAGRLLDESPPPLDGSWLQRFDPEYNNGSGRAEWTTDPAKAMRFETMGEASCLWRYQSVKRPLRLDGRPNRPLTAYNVKIGSLP